MLAPLLKHETIIALAVVGGVFSILSSVLAARGGGSGVARWCNFVAYGFMGASIALFIFAGLLRG